MNKYPSISIITPSFNQALFLDSCIRSIASQGYENLEHIVMDGGSSDESPEIIRHYGAHISKAVIGPDLGQSDAINKGIMLSRGGIIGWLNSDDALLPGSLAAVAEYFSQNPECEWLAGHCHFTDVYGKPGWQCVVKERPAEDYVRFWDGIFLPQPSVFFRRALWDKVGGLNISYRYAMDLDLWLRFLSASPLHCLDATLSINRVHGATKTRTGKEDAITEFVNILTASNLNQKGANYSPPDIEKKLRYYFVGTELNRLRSESASLIQGLTSYKLGLEQRILLAAIAAKNVLRTLSGRRS